MGQRTATCAHSSHTAPLSGLVASSRSQHINLHGYGGCATIRLTKRLFGKVATVRNIPSILTCYSRVTGNHPLGKIPKSKCNVIYYEDNDTTLATCCVKCLEGRVNVYGVPHHSPIARRYISHRQCTRTKCEAVCAVVHIPDKLGTGVVENGYWQCGYEIYVSLPRN